MKFDILEQYKFNQELYEIVHKETYWKRKPNMKVEEREYLQIYLRASHLKNLYIREDYDILLYLGDLGGLFEISFFFGYVLTVLFIKKLF